MKKLSMALIFCFTCTITNAQPVFKELHKKVFCASPETIFSLITGPDYKEKPFWNGLGLDEKSSFVIFHNEKTGTFTIIEFNDKVACLLGEGFKSQLDKNV